jgi:hypothetical protein
MLLFIHPAVSMAARLPCRLMIASYLAAYVLDYRSPVMMMHGLDACFKYA